jgi:hypothetical protein
MAFRVIHQIFSECDIQVEKTGRDHVLIRITERDPENPDPTDFSIEGNPKYIADFMSTCAGVLANIEEIVQRQAS